MLSSTFFHWQKRVNLSLGGKDVGLVIHLQTVQLSPPTLRLPCLTSRWTSGRSSLSSCHRSPLCMAAKGQIHKQQIKPKIFFFLKNNVIWELMWICPLCMNWMIELEAITGTVWQALSFHLCPYMWTGELRATIFQLDSKVEQHRALTKWKNWQVDVMCVSH